MEEKLIIAVDGPVASGKSTVGKRLAKCLDYQFLDTGVIYRAVAYLVIQRKIFPDDVESVTHLCRGLSQELVEQVGEELRIEAGGEILFKDGEVSEKLHTAEVSAMSSKIAKIRQVRESLKEIQRKCAIGGGIVMAGRDIGTVILPEAELKFYIDASIEERANRRYLELVDRGKTPVLDLVLSEMRERDQRDRNREIAPLTIAQDAIVIDTSEKSIDEVVELMLKSVLERPRACEKS